ncbi:MAG TPA: hypothetical protein VFX30_12870 [bacterium]|nr:hypothetical protein [bacterium]
MRHRPIVFAAGLLMLATFSQNTRAELPRGSGIDVRATTSTAKVAPKDLSKWGRALKNYPLEPLGADVTVAPTENPNRIVIAVRSCSRSGDLAGDGADYKNKFYCPLNLPVGAKIRSITAFPREPETWSRHREVMSETSMAMIHVWRETVVPAGTHVEEISGTDEPGFLFGGRGFWTARDLPPLTIHYETDGRTASSAYYISVDNTVQLNVDASTSTEARIFLGEFNRTIQSIIGLLVVEYEPASD